MLWIGTRRVPGTALHSGLPTKPSGFSLAQLSSSRQPDTELAGPGSNGPASQHEGLRVTAPGQGRCLSFDVSPPSLAQNSFIGDRGPSHQSLLISKNWKCPFVRAAECQPPESLLSCQPSEAVDGTTIELSLLSPWKGAADTAHGTVAE